MYKCNECGRIFEKPWERYDEETGAYDSGCIYCSSDYFEETYICTHCGDYGADEQNGLCKECKAALKEDTWKLIRQYAGMCEDQYSVKEMICECCE